MDIIIIHINLNNMICKLIKDIHKDIIQCFNYSEIYDISFLDYNYDIGKWFFEMNHIEYQIYVADGDIIKYKQIQ